MAWTIDTIHMAARGMRDVETAKMLSRYNVDPNNAGIDVDVYVTPEDLDQIATVMRKKPSKTNSRTLVVTAFGCRFWTALPWAD